MKQTAQTKKTTKGRRAPATTALEPDHPIRAILSDRFQPAFNAMPRDILEATSQQFCDRLLVYREWAQNSQDAGARQIQCSFRMEDTVSGGFTFVATWVDNGAGMSRTVVENSYLRIFSSTKEETRNETVGYFSLGRLIVFAFVPDLIVQETVTLPGQAEESATLIRLFPDGTGEVYELDRVEAAAQLGSTALKQGTMVTIKYRVPGGEAEFAAEVEKSVASMRKECRWIRPRLTVTTARYEPSAVEGRPGALALGSEVINQPFGVPGRLSKSYPFELSSGLGKGLVSIGIRPDDKDPMPDLTTLTLTAGGIPLERTGGLAWCGGDREFSVSNLRIVIESFQWRPPIGRHRVKRDDPFFQEVVPKVFDAIILGRYIPWLCAKMKDPRERRGLFGYHRNVEAMFFDLLCESTRHDFAIPPCLMELPLFRQFGSWRSKGHSVNDLDAATQFYYTTQKPELGDYRDAFDSNRGGDADGGSIVVDLYGTLYANTFIENRYASKVQRVTDHFFIEEDTSPVGKALRQRLQQVAREYLTYPCRTVHIARFLKLGAGQVPETCARAHAQKDRQRVGINLNNPDVARMAELALQGGTEEDRFLGMHFLLREILLADGLDMPDGKRQKALQEHCARRNATPEPIRDRRAKLADLAAQFKARRLRTDTTEGGQEQLERELLAILLGDDEVCGVETAVATL
jgi:hypothetical protein